MTLSLVTVVIPTHNRPDLLHRALRSVFSQAGLGKDFEVEVNVAYDEESDVHSKTRKAFPKAHFLKNTKKGPSAPRNLAIISGKGEFIAFLDDDDVWLPHKLRFQLDLLCRNPEVDVLYGQMSVSDDEKLVDAWPREAPSGDVFEAFLTRTDDFIHFNTLLTRREVFERVGVFDESLPTMEHYDLALRMARHYRFLFVRGVVAHGYFSREGLWYRTLANGENARVIPRIVEGALSLLPEGLEKEKISRRARLAVFETVASQTANFETARSLHSYMKQSLESWPWMVEEESGQILLSSLGRKLAGKLVREEGATGLLQSWGQFLRDTCKSRGLTYSAPLRRALAEGWKGAAQAFRSRQEGAATFRAIMRSVYYRPQQLFQPPFFKLFVWSVIMSLNGKA